MLHCNSNATICNTEIELELELELDIELEINIQPTLTKEYKNEKSQDRDATTKIRDEK